MEDSGTINHVLITGCAGFIGHHLGMRLLEEGRTVIGVDRLDDQYNPALKQRNLQLLRNLSQETDTTFQFEEMDLLDRSALSDLFEELNVDAVVHAAARAGAQYSMEQPLRCLRTNVEGTSNLLEQVADLELDQFLYVSSASVYGNHDEVPLPEDLEQLEPVSTYGVSKHAAEMICCSYRKHHNLRVNTVRLFNVFGPRQRPDMAVHTFARHLEQEESILVYGEGTMTRDFTYITDAIDGICSVLGNEQDHGVYNIGGGNVRTVNELVQQLEQAFEVNPQVEHRSVPEGEPVRLEADLQKSKQELGFEPSVSFEDGIQRFVDWFRSRSVPDDSSGSKG